MTSFDVHVHENVAPFNVGASLILVDDAELLDSVNLMHYLSHHKCTYIDMVPSIWMFHIRSNAVFPPSLRIGMFGGEKMTALRCCVNRFHRLM